MPDAPQRPLGATITVDTLSDSDSHDNELSLREALQIAAGDATNCLTAHEKAQISGASFTLPLYTPFCGLGALDPPRYDLVSVNPGVGYDYADNIVFSAGPGTISLGSALPRVEQNDNINGSVSGGKIVIEGNGLTANGLSIFRFYCALCTATTGNQIRNLIIRNFNGHGIANVTTSLADMATDGMILQGLEIYQNTKAGIYLQSVGGDENKNNRNLTLGGTGAGEGNALYGNGWDGIRIDNSPSYDTSSQNIVIEGNYIGLKGSGSTGDDGNAGYGILLNNTNGARVGGDTSFSRNFIAGNNADGIKIAGAGADNNSVFNNYIGMTAAGIVARGNSASGVAIIGGASNQIGASGKGNVIVASTYGVFVSDSGADDNGISANQIGVLGTSAFANGTGVVVQSGAKRTVIGGTAANAGNTIAGNTNDGVFVNGAGTDATRVEGNGIGVTNGSVAANKVGVRVSDGAKDTVIGGPAQNYTNYIGGNASHGVVIEGTGTSNTWVIGNGVGNNGWGQTSFAMNGGDGIQVLSPAASTVISKNVISENVGHGVVISGVSATNNQVLANYIGLLKSGSPPFLLSHTNGGDGVRIQAGAHGNQVGLPGLGNTISGNGNDGVGMRGSGSSNNVVYNNVIGLVPDQAAKLGNGASGVAMLQGAGGNEIGGSRDLGRANVIAGNGFAGVYIETVSNTVTGNLIGTNRFYDTMMGNGGAGVFLNVAAGNTIGYTASQNLGNIIGGNGGPGIDISGDAAKGNRIFGNQIGVNLAGSAAIPNGIGIRIVGGPDNNQIGNGTSTMANTISGNASHGVGIYNAGTTGNSISGNTIGLATAGVAALPNASHGVVIQEGASGNTVDANTISGNGGNGVWISDSGTNSNVVMRNSIGLSAAGNAQAANTLNGVIVRNGAQYNQIGSAGNGNTISGNRQDGIALDGSGTAVNLVMSNTVGLNLAGTAAISNAGAGIRLTNGASGNYIGWDIGNPAGNLVSGNGSDGIALVGLTTDGNYVGGNVIGLNRAQNARIANGASGIALVNGTRNNLIGYPVSGKFGGNLIAGNNGSGIYIAGPGTAGNQVFANTIGTNRSNANGLGNAGAGVGLYNGAVTTTVGGDRFNDLGNLVVNNGGPGVDLANSNTRNNTIAGNIIGANPTTNAAMPNGIGIRMYGGTLSNTVGGAAPGLANVLSGNASHGIGLYNSGTVSNVIVGNFIGTNLTGSLALPNAQYGIVIQEASSSNVITGNLISGNGSDGVNLNGAGTRLNLILGNKIGTELGGNAALPNAGNGVAILGGATENRIGALALRPEMNTISGNALAGVLVNGLTTVSNTIPANRIGTSASGMAAVPNSGAGISLQSARSTDICVSSSFPSLIGGNLGPGILISAGDRNRVLSTCQIGLAADLSSPLGNGLAARHPGISLTNTLSNFVVAGAVANNGGAGIAVAGSSHANIVLPLSAYANRGIPIDLNDDGPTLNDPGDVDSGPNTLLNYPVVTTRVGDTITGTACANCEVDVYFAYASTQLPGGAVRYETAVLANGAGVFSVVLPVSIMNHGVSYALQAHQYPGGGLNSSEISPWWGVWIPSLRR